MANGFTFGPEGAQVIFGKGAVGGWNRKATLATRGAISLSSSSHLPANEASRAMKPVTLPPGRGRLSGPHLSNPRGALLSASNPDPCQGGIFDDVSDIWAQQGGVNLRRRLGVNGTPNSQTGPPHPRHDGDRDRNSAGPRVCGSPVGRGIAPTQFTAPIYPIETICCLFLGPALLVT